MAMNALMRPLALSPRYGSCCTHALRKVHRDERIKPVAKRLGPTADAAFPEPDWLPLDPPQTIAAIARLRRRQRVEDRSMANPGLRSGIFFHA